ncbi:sulfatase-like hydrolase/transferase [Akkermansiaceae bacterium]|nr:sulfatase-like hydrolase/transferase [Akkermansiaceae bacterium]
MTRSFFLLACLLLGAIPAFIGSAKADSPHSKPNIIFVVADDMGFMDTGYSGNPIVKTPHLDRMAAEGLRFDYFYSAAGTCSPGRMAILTGRTPLRARMVTTVGAMQEGEVTVAAALQTAGYETGHFGKWGLGRDGTHPLKVGFDEAVWSKNYFDLGAAFFVGDSDKQDEAPIKTTGDTSVAIIEIALDFIGKRAERGQPFFAQICFGSPHAPHQAAEEFKKLYPDLPEAEQNLWGEISGLDAAVGKLRGELKRLGIAENTLLWFVSDNGGISDTSGIEKKGRIGARTIGLIDWPRKIPRPMRSDVPVCHIDMYPTVLDVAGVSMGHQPVIDGVSIVPLFDGRMESRPKPLGFASGRYAGKSEPPSCEILNSAWIDGRHILRLDAPSKRRREESVTLYDIVDDPGQEKDIAGGHPQEVGKMLKELKAWQEGVKASFAGKDYLR